MRHWVILTFLILSPFALATKSPLPQDTLPVDFEFGVPNTVGYNRGAYSGITFGQMLFDSGSSPLEEAALGVVRQWVFQTQGGTVSIGRASYKATCIRANRINTLTPQQEFYYEFRISALEGSCAASAEARSVEFVFTMDDFVIKKFKSGSLRFFGQTGDLLLYPVPLRTPEKAKAQPVDGGLFLTGRLTEVPFVADLHLEFLLRPKCQMSCRRTSVDFDPATCKATQEIAVDWDRDPYSSVLTAIDAKGKWGITVPKTGGAVCMRLTGGGWLSPVTAAELP